MKQLQIRQIDLEKDLERIVELSIGWDDLHPIGEMRSHVQQSYPKFDPQGFLVIEKAREIIGYVEGHLGFWQKDAITGAEMFKDDSKIGCIERVVVDEKYRRKGIGSVLMKSILGYLMGKGAKVVFVDTLTNEKKEIAAKKLYKKFEFREIYRWKSREYGETKMLIKIL